MNEYFKELRNLSQRIDGDIKELEKTWKTPHLLIGGYGANREELNLYADKFFDSLKEVKGQLIDDQKSRFTSITATANYLTSVDDFYQDLKRQCEEVETVLSEFGYKPLSDSGVCSPDSESDSVFGFTSQQPLETNSISSIDAPQRSTDEAETRLLSTVPRPRSIATPVIKTASSIIISKASKEAQKKMNSPYCS